MHDKGISIECHMADMLLVAKLTGRETQSLCQLSLLPSAGREMSTSQNAVMLRGWGIKAGTVHSNWINLWVAGKTV